MLRKDKKANLSIGKKSCTSFAPERVKQVNSEEVIVLFEGCLR